MHIYRGSITTRETNNLSGVRTVPAQRKGWKILILGATAVKITVVYTTILHTQSKDQTWFYLVGQIDQLTTTGQKQTYSKRFRITVSQHFTAEN